MADLASTGSDPQAEWTRLLSTQDPSRIPMRRYWIAVASIFAVFMVLFVVAEALRIPLLTDPRPWLAGHTVPAALTGVALLIADVALPVPSSLVMIVHGAVFGAVVGAALSLIGSFGAALVGFAVGRRGGRLLDRLVPPHERARSNKLLARWGLLAIIVTRPVPLLAETTVILAGASPLGWRRSALASLLGSIPAAVLYALAGSAVAARANPVAVFVLVLLIAAATWVIGSLAERRRAPREAGV